GFAVDNAGSVYVADAHNNRVLKLAAGSSSQTELPFTGLGFFNGQHSSGVAVDSAGSVYVADSLNARVLKLAAGSTTQTVVPFASCPASDSGCAYALRSPRGIAVDSAGNIYVGDMGTADRSAGRVLKLTTGSTTQVVLPLGPD